MKQIIRFFCILGCWLAGMCSAWAQQYVVRGGTGEPMLAADETAYKLKVYVVNGVENVTISYTSSSSQHQWYRYKTSRLGDSEPVESTQNGTTSTLSHVEDGYGYYVDEGVSSSYYIWIIDYAKHPVRFENVAVSENSSCSGVLLQSSAEIDNLRYYYPTNGLSRTLAREFEVSFNTLEWDDEGQLFREVRRTVQTDNPFREAIDSVFVDTDIVLTGDQYAAHFGQPQSATIGYYETSMIALEADTTVFQEIAGNMATTGEGQLSAPATVRFTAYANDPVASLYVWKIYRNEDGEDNPLIRFTDPEVEYTFTEFGQYTAMIEVSDRTGNCYQSMSFALDVAESFLDVPNAFSPGTTPGVNDEFRVAYKSLVRFSCWIFNRWGQQIYHWTNPAQGWDGKKNGKLVLPGVYFYVIEAEGSDGRHYKLKGDINILRGKRERNFESSGEDMGGGEVTE